MIGSAKILLAAALPLALSILAGCASQTAVVEAPASQSIAAGEAGCLKTHGPLIKTDIIDQKTVVFWDLAENIYRVGTRDICLATTEIGETSFLDIVRPRSLFSSRERREICTHKLDSVTAEYFVPRLRPQKMDCLISSVSVISDAEYEALILEATGGGKKPRIARRLN